MLSMGYEMKSKIIMSCLFILILAVFNFFIVWITTFKIERSPSTRLDDKNQVEILNKIEFAAHNDRVLRFNSAGGVTSNALKIAYKLQELQIHLIIDRECSSNCAEVLLPAAKKVTFENQPIIGFHGNMQSYRFYTSEFATSDQNYCNWEFAEEELTIARNANLNTNFWEVQMAKLAPNLEFEYSHKKCPWRIYNFENAVWLPTSQQLREQWGLQFDGDVCADSLNECSVKINNRWKAGTRIVVGDEVYVSKGR